MKIGNYELDFTDADVLDKIQNAYEKMGKTSEEEKEKDSYKNLKGTEKIRFECKIIKDFIEEIFGKEAMLEICGTGNSFNKHIEIVMSINDGMLQSKEEMTQKVNKYAKYDVSRIEK